MKRLWSKFNRNKVIENAENAENAEKLTWYVDRFSKFFNTLHFHFWIDTGRLSTIKVEDATKSDLIKSVTVWEISQRLDLTPTALEVRSTIMLSRGDMDLANLKLIIEVDGNKTFVDLSLINSKISEGYRSKGLHQKFREYLAVTDNATMLDIGGRARSGLLRAKDFPGVDVDVLDILPGEGVDIVGDAHSLSLLVYKKYDAILCMFVFEHLLMPWKAAVEMSKVLNVGGYAYVHTHQTIGMHDFPWDYYRFSDSAWHGIFNKYTGFEIIDTELNDLMHIIPFNYSRRYRDAEKSAGFETSTVLIRKVSEPSVDWAVKTKEIVSDLYPSHEDGNLSHVSI